MHTDAVEITFERLVHFGKLFGRNVGGVRVKVFEQTNSGFFFKFGHVNRINIACVDVANQIVDFAAPPLFYNNLAAAASQYVALDKHAENKRYGKQQRQPYFY